MILVGQYDSPVTRRVAIALHHYRIPFTRDTRSIFGDAAAVGKISPLTRIPALVLDEGEVLIDSAAILDHLDEQAPDAALIPASGPARRLVLQMTHWLKAPSKRSRRWSTRGTSIPPNIEAPTGLTAALARPALVSTN